MYRTISDLIPNRINIAVPWCSGYQYCRTYLTKPEITFCAVSDPARDVLKVCDGENPWQWSRLKMRPNASGRSTISQKQFIIIGIVTIITISIWNYLILKYNISLRKYYIKNRVMSHVNGVFKIKTDWCILTMNISLFDC